MTALRLASAAALAAAVAFAACGNSAPDYDCTIPIPGELGADGGPDPCHCNIPDTLSCHCTLPGVGVAQFQQCAAALAASEDAGKMDP
jgi:hypothetical protein